MDTIDKKLIATLRTFPFVQIDVPPKLGQCEQWQEIIRQNMWQAHLRTFAAIV